MISTDKDRVRLLISDVGGSDGSSFLFSDEEVETFLDIAPSVRMASALALRTIAGNEAQVSKRIKFLDLSTDGPAVAKSLMDLADRLEVLEDDDVEFEIAAMGVDHFSIRELRGY
jgi:hypothetical protein